MEKSLQSRFDSRQGQGIVSLLQSIHISSGPNQPAIQCVPGDISAEVKRPEREAGLSAASNEVMNEWNYTSIPPCTFMTCIGTNLPLFLP